MTGPTTFAMPHAVVNTACTLARSASVYRSALIVMAIG